MPVTSACGWEDDARRPALGARPRALDREAAPRGQAPLYAALRLVAAALRAAAFRRTGPFVATAFLAAAFRAIGPRRRAEVRA